MHGQWNRRARCIAFRRTRPTRRHWARGRGGRVRRRAVASPASRRARRAARRNRVRRTARRRATRRARSTQASRGRRRGSPGGDLLVTAVGEDPVLALLEQRVDRQLAAAWRSASVSAFLSVTIIAAWSRCAPPSGSLTTLSMRPSCFRRGAVMPSVSAASGACSADFHRIDAQPSGEITE